ncbi:MAG: polyprenyl synthetase family protein [Nitrososphaerales archaeon]
MEVKTEMPRVLELLVSNKNRLDKIVLDFLPEVHESAEISELYKLMRDYPSRGGKGLRGTMCLLWCSLFGGKTDDAIITAAALELFQNWILIHDDIEDQSDLRRGLPALHKKVGLELAINAGDALHAKMWELLLTNQRRLSDPLTLEILSEFAAMINATTEGQQMELAWTIGNKWDIRESDYFLMVTKKASWYTCITPARLGTLLGASQTEHKNADITTEDLLDEIVVFGTNLGIAFQIIDDVLNLTANESKYGKEILGDLFEGKRTLMLIHLLAHSDQKQKAKIIQLLSKTRQSKTYADAKYIFEKMKSAGSIDYAKNVAKSMSKKALSEFDRIAANRRKLHPETYHTTRLLIEYLTTRDY